MAEEIMTAEQLSSYYGVDVKSQVEQITERLGAMPQVYRKGYQRAMRGHSMKSAIKAQCLECCGWQREEIKRCVDLGCPLYEYRPTAGEYRVIRRAPGFRNAVSQGAIKPVESTQYAG